MKHISVQVSEDLHRHLRKYCLQNNLRMQDVVREAVAHETHYDTHCMAIKMFPRQRQTPQITFDQVVAHA